MSCKSALEFSRELFSHKHESVHVCRCGHTDTLVSIDLPAYFKENYYGQGVKIMCGMCSTAFGDKAFTDKIFYQCAVSTYCKLSGAGSRSRVGAGEAHIGICTACKIGAQPTLGRTRKKKRQRL